MSSSYKLLNQTDLKAEGDNSSTLASIEEGFGASVSAVKSWWVNFKAFIHNGSSVELGIGFIIGGTFTDLMRSLMDDIVSPPMEMAFGSTLKNVFVVLKSGASSKEKSYNTLEEARSDGAVTENFGLFIQNFFNFVIIAFVLYLLIQFTSKLKHEMDTLESKETPRLGKCPECLENVRIQARRCPHCTSVISPPARAAVTE